MSLHFIKMNGLGNDFVVIDGRSVPVDLSDAAVRKLADRKTGIGCDQLIVLRKPSEAAVKEDAVVAMEIRNADGVEVESCGNAARCIADMILKERNEPRIRIETKGGILTCFHGPSNTITVDMGPVRTGWAEIPLATECDTLTIPVGKGPLHQPVGVNVGNPHAVFFVENAEDVDLETYGPQLETHPFFPEKVNVEVVHLAARDTIRMRVWERGVGITRACGTGACAVAVAAHRRRMTDRKVKVVLDGGELMIEWLEDVSGTGGHVLMTGPIEVGFRGHLEADLQKALS